MFHWQWFILVITIFFVVSNGGEGIKRRSFNLNPGVKKRKRDIEEPEKLSTNVKFPLWVSISGFGNIGVNTQFKNVSDNLYEFTLPFLVQIKESDVLVNRSAKQDKNLAFPFFVRVTHIGDNKNKYANETTLDTVRLAFPFDLEVTSVSLIETHLRRLSVKPQARSAIAASLATAGAILGTLVAAVVITVVTIHVVRAAYIAATIGAVELLRPHDYANGQVDKPRNIIGWIAAKVAGSVVSFLPGIRKDIIAGIKHAFQTFGDSVGIFINEIFSLGILGDFMRLIQLNMNLFGSIPFTPWSKVELRGNDPHPPPPLGILPPPPTIIEPKLPVLPTPNQKDVFVIKIYYGQTEIPGFPGYTIAWPGRPEPPPTDLVILRPIIPNLPTFPNVRLIWPIQSPTPLRPNIIIIQPRQVFLPGYLNVIIVWPSQPEPTDKDITILRPNQETIPNIVGVRLLWPGQKLSQPIVIFLQPKQRQHPQFPTIIFHYPGDPPPPNAPGLTIVSPPRVNIPNCPSVTIAWPGVPPPSKMQPLFVSPDDAQLPQLPNVFINNSKHQPSPQSGFTYILPGQTKIPGYPGVPLKWLPPNKTPSQMPISTVYIPPNVNTVPGHPDYGISRPGRPSPHNLHTVKLGAPTLPSNPNVTLTWLEMPTDLVLKPTPDIYNVNIQRSKRSIGESLAILNDIDEGWTTERGDLHGQETDFFEREYILPNTTFYRGDLDVPLGHIGNGKVAHENEVVPKPWMKHLHMSKLTQHVKQILGLVCC